MSLKKIIICLIVLIIIFFACIYGIFYILSCTDGVYEVNISSVCVSNDSVGRDWAVNYTEDGKMLFDGYKVTAPLNNNITKIITAKIIERDKYSDEASRDIAIALKDGATSTATITVFENNGRFKGNCAKWEIAMSVKLIKRIPPQK